MVTISFQADSEEASKLFSMLKAYGVKNLTKKTEEEISLTDNQKSELTKRMENAEKGNVKSQEEAIKIFLECIK